MPYLCIPMSVPQVSQLVSYFTPLVSASIGMASKILDHQQQMNLLDQTKTLAESALQMLYAAKEGGGNPKVLLFHSFKFEGFFIENLYLLANSLTHLSSGGTYP